MADPFNYLAGFNPAQSILQSVQGGIASAGQGDSAAVAREKMQMQREEFGLTQQLKREQMAQSKDIANAELALRQSQVGLAEAAKNLQISEARFKEDARNKTQVAFEAYMGSPTPENLFKYQGSLAMSNPESVSASTEANKNFTASVGKDVSAGYSKALFTGSSLLLNGKSEEAQKHFSDMSTAMQDLAKRTGNADAKRAADFMGTFSTIASESKSNPEMAKQASARIAELALGDPIMFDLYKKQAELENIEAQTKLAESKALSGEDVQVKDVFTKRALSESADSSRMESDRIDSIDSILGKITSGEVKLPEKAGESVGRWIRDKVPFFADDVTAVKKEFMKLTNSEAMKSLPKGTPSDADMKIAREGLMSSDVNRDQFVKGLEAMRRLSERSMKYYDAKADWISKNGSMGNLSSDRSIMGGVVKKGTGFNEWWRGFVGEEPRYKPRQANNVSVDEAAATESVAPSSNQQPQVRILSVRPSR